MKAHKCEHRPEEKRNYLDLLPEELVLKIWNHLAVLAPDNISEKESILQRFPFRTLDNPCEPHPGLRAYPFLGQVCKQWKATLEKPNARRLIWEELVIDFSHELITAVHTPIAWSDKRPSNEDFQKSFKQIRLDTSKILNFIHLRRDSLKKIVLMSSEGYYGEDAEFIKFENKHDFTMVGFGMLCGMLMDSLEELTVMRCNDFFDMTSHGLTAIRNLRNLKALRLEDVKWHGEEGDVINQLSTLSKLTELSLTTNSYNEKWLVRDKSRSWRGLCNLQKLTLSGHSLLNRIPDCFSSLPLTHLDLSFSRVVDFSALRGIQTLQVLSVQNIFREPASEGENDDEESQEDTASDLFLAELCHLTNLTALNLSENFFTSVPNQLSCLTKLEYLDLSQNETLKVSKKLAPLYGLQRLKLVDARYIHKEHDIAYWSDEKCKTMTHLREWQQALRRRGSHVLFVLDTA